MSDAPPTSARHPLGPLVWRTRPTRLTTTRLSAAAVLAASSMVLYAAWRLSPDPSGLGTHTQLGLAPCSLVTFTGYPCPTCGMTTAFAHTVRGHLIAAFGAQPAGLLLALSTMLTAVISSIVLVTGRTWQLNWYRVTPAKLGGLAVAILLLGWAYKLATGLLDGSLPVR